MHFESRSIINGGLVRQFIGKCVSMIVKFDPGASGQLLKCKTTDNYDIRCNLTETIGSPVDWVEIIGIPAGSDAIRVKEVIIFDKEEEEFDVESHNMLVQILNNCKDFYRQG